MDMIVAPHSHTQSHTVTVTHCEIKKKFSSWAGHNLETVFYKECLLGETETERRSFTNCYRPGKGTFHWPENGGSSLRITNVNLEHKKKHDFNLKSFTVSLSYHHFPAHE